MKHFAAFLFVFLAVFCTAFVSVSSAERVIDLEKDAVFTCGSNPEEFSGKTYNDLYVLLNGCTSMRSTIIPEDNVFLTLRDITVNGTIYYLDDTYDTETGVYREAVVGENLTSADHWLNIAGKSVVNRIEMACIDPHTCHLGVQFQVYVDELYLYPVNPLSRGKIALHGYIDPLVDEKTDYYHDTDVASYPGFDFGKFEGEFARTGVVNIGGLYVNMNRYVDQHLDKGLWDETLTEEEYIDKLIEYSEFFAKTYASAFTFASEAINEKAQKLNKEVEATWHLLKRGLINKIFISNKYEQDSGETHIVLSNFRCKQMFISNNHREDGYYQDTFDLNWKPVIESAGFSSIGIVSVYSNVRMTAIDTPPLSAGDKNKDNEIFPLYIDAVVVGTEGRKIDLDLSHTKIFMLNSLGGLDKNSRLNIRFKDGRNTHSINQTAIGILSVNGGKVNILSDYIWPNSPSVIELFILPGRDDLRFKPDKKDGVIDATSIMNIKEFKNSTEKVRLVSYEIEELLGEADYDIAREIRTKPLSYSSDSHMTVCGRNWAEYMSGYYLRKHTSETEKSNYAQIETENVSLGDIYVDSSLNDDFLSGSCNFYQWGKFGGITTPLR